MKGYIYQIENLITHESYIGQTVDIKRRKNTHFNKLRKNKEFYLHLDSESKSQLVGRVKSRN